MRNAQGSRRNAEVARALEAAKEEHLARRREMAKQIRALAEVAADGSHRKLTETLHAHRICPHATVRSACSQVAEGGQWYKHVRGNALWHGREEEACAEHVASTWHLGARAYVCPALVAHQSTRRG